MKTRFTARALWVEKAGNPSDAYEDAWAARAESIPSTRQGCYAVADGATSSSFSREWAQILAKAVVDRRVCPDLTLWEAISDSQRSWSSEVDTRRLPWFAEANARRGAFATLLRLSLMGRRPRISPHTGSWKAVAIGDTCLFQVREGQLVTTFPIGSHTEFTFSPPLVPSRPEVMSRHTPQPKWSAGTWLAGDWFLLCTDALAEWILLEHAASRPIWQELVALAGAMETAGFRELVDGLRRDKRIKNDDVTLLSVEVRVGY